jgi:hypothetical protein
MANTLSKIQKTYPKVKHLIDSDETIVVSVARADIKGGTKKDPGQCALARACLRQKLADAVIIGLCYSYLIKGDMAMRFKTSLGVQREITSFDRTKYFAEGDFYKLSKVPESSKLGVRKYRSGRKTPKTKNNKPQPRHFTSDVRLVSHHE